MNTVLWALGISLGLNLLLFIPAYLYKTDKLTDLSYSITFIIVTCVAFAKSSKDAGHLLVLAMVLLWALRLGGFLFIRINKAGRDSRFDGLRDNFWKFLGFWLLQGLSVFIVLAAVLALLDRPQTDMNVISYLGWWLFGLGLALETVADWQKYRFSQSKTKDTWIDTGFWRVCRHPNYLGEIMVWSGIYIFCLPSLSGWPLLLALASPLYIAGILLFFSGIPMLEKSANQKWGGQIAYRNYKSKVPVLIPTANSLHRLK